MSYNPINENINKLPTYLYKYRAFDDNGYALDLIKNGDAFFSSPKNLNDPFETFFKPKSEFIHLPESELVKYLREKTKQRFPNADRKERRRLIKVAMDRAKIHKRNPSVIAEEMHEMQNQKFGILSLTKNPLSIPMWAYYSENHAGFCVGLKTTVIGEHQLRVLENEGLFTLHDVKYTSDIPEVMIDMPLDDGKNDHDYSESVHYTKSTDWKHEDETRLIFWNYTNKVYRFGPELAGEVILGYNISDEKTDTMIQILRDNGSTLELKKVKKSHEFYGLELETIEY